MARVKWGQVQIIPTLPGAEVLSSRVNPNIESIQYEFMTRVISSVKRLTRTK